MEMTLLPQLDLLGEGSMAIDEDVRTQVWGLLTTLYPRNDLVERRRDTRYPFPQLLYLTPVGRDGVSPEGESLVVTGKHLSEHGLGFYHQKPLPYRRVIVSMGDDQRALDRFLGGPELVPLHAPGLVRERRPLPAIGPLADGFGLVTARARLAPSRSPPDNT